MRGGHYLKSNTNTDDKVSTNVFLKLFRFTIIHRHRLGDANLSHCLMVLCGILVFDVRWRLSLIFSKHWWDAKSNSTVRYTQFVCVRMRGRATQVWLLYLCWWALIRLKPVRCLRCSIFGNFYSSENRYFAIQYDCSWRYFLTELAWVFFNPDLLICCLTSIG